MGTAEQPLEAEGSATCVWDLIERLIAAMGDQTCSIEFTTDMTGTKITSLRALSRSIPAAPVADEHRTIRRSING